MIEKGDSYVFISYARENLALASELYARLNSKKHRIPCWMDQYDLPVDEQVFQAHILTALQHANGLVLVKTQHAQESLYVGRELAEAEKAGVPVFSYRIRSEKKSNALTNFFRQIKTAFVATRIKMRITQPFWLSATLLGVMILAMSAFIFEMSRRITPVVAEVIQGQLPEAAQVLPIAQPIPDLNPKMAAPFFFVPDTILLADEFEGQGGLEDTHYYFDIRPRLADVATLQQDGWLLLDYPGRCLEEGFRWECETEIHGPDVDLRSVQYFGVRARALALTKQKEISISLSTSGPRRWRTGFGWALSDHVTPFYRANSNLPEEDFYAYLPLDDGWHAYEILIDPLQSVLFFYMDGQLIDRNPLHYMEDWLDAPLMLMLFIDAVDDVVVNQGGPAPRSTYQIDQIILGGYVP
jgi:hypothetical protein